jgi:putative alpha-1,2-mannosidase
MKRSIMEKPIRLKAGFIRPKKNGGWQPFDPRRRNNNTEGNAWQYTFFLCCQYIGNDQRGKDKFEAKLDEMFNSE